MFPSILACRRGLGYQVALALRHRLDRALYMQGHVQLIGADISLLDTRHAMHSAMSFTSGYTLLSTGCLFSNHAGI